MMGGMGRVFDGGYAEYMREVAPQQPGVDPGDAGEQLVMVDPDDSDVGERGQIGDVCRPW
jgi:hypothetical protein